MVSLSKTHLNYLSTLRGALHFDALLYDVIIWVEGPSDRIYIEKWLDLVLKHPLSSQIGILPYGGKPNLLHFEIEDFKLINRKSIIIMDSDKKSETEIINPEINHFISKCKTNDIYCWLTDRREIENYIPVDILNAVLKIPSGNLCISKYDSVFDKLKEEKRNFDNQKVKLAKEITPFITFEHIKSDSEFCSELQSLIENLNAS